MKEAILTILPLKLFRLFSSIVYISRFVIAPTVVIVTPSFDSRTMLRIFIIYAMI